MNCKQEQPLVSVGIPAYNRPEGLARTLQCITGQTYSNLEIIISDNCSPNEAVKKVSHEYMKNDSRVKYYHQEENKGPALNFRFVLEQAAGEYFMWASDDDEWEKEFVTTGVRTLLKNPDFDAWFCSLDIIDRLSRVILRYPSFSCFTSTLNKRRDVIRYLKIPGGMGKANIIYSIYKRGALLKTINEYCFSDAWASDLAFNLAFLARYNLITTSQVLFHKRLARRSVRDEQDKITPIVIKNFNRITFHPKKTVKLIRELCKAVRTTPYKNTVVFVMISRVPLSIMNYIITRANRKANSLAKRVRKLMFGSQ